MAVTTGSWSRADAPGPPPGASGPSGADDLVDLDVAAEGPGPHDEPPARRPGAGLAAGGARGVGTALALAAAASLVTGVVVHHRAAAAAAAAPPSLEVGYPEVRSRPAVGDRTPRARVVLPVLNASAGAVEVTAVDLTERAGRVTLDVPRVRLEPGERTRVALRVTPQCDLAASDEPDVATIAVSGLDGDHAVRTELAAPFGRPALDAQLQDLCASTGLGRPVDVAVSLLPDDATLVLRMTNTSTEATDLALWAPSASGIVSDPPLPREVGPGEEVSLSLTAAPRCETWSGGLPSMSVDVVSSRPPRADGITLSTDRDVPSGWSALLTSWLGGQVARTCDPS